MRFSCEFVEEWNDDTLEATGVRWTEPHKFIEGVLAMVGGLGLFVGLCELGGGILAVGRQGAGEIVLFGVAVTAVSLGVLWRAIVFPGRAREIVFRRDGAMETPLGLSTGFLWPGERWLSHLGIHSIEWEQVAVSNEKNYEVYTHGVIIFYQSGDVNHVAKNLMPDDARKLAVMLSQARKRLKDSVVMPVLLGHENGDGGQGRRVIE